MEVNSLSDSAMNLLFLWCSSSLTSPSSRSLPSLSVISPGPQVLASAAYVLV